MEIETGLVKDLMSKEVQTAYSHSTVRKAVKVMAQHGIGSVVVIDNTGPRGVFAERDLLSKVLAKGRDCDNTILMEVLSPLFPAIDSDATFADAARAMVAKKSRLMVFEGSELHGIVTATDIVRLVQHLNRRVDLSSVVSRDVVTELPETPVGTVIQDMDERRIGSVLVGEEERSMPYGIFTERDLLLRILVKGLRLDTMVGECVTVPLTTAPAGITGVDAAKMMTIKHIKRLPLVEQNEIVGIVTARDIVEAFANAG